jgi:hypothetical protein
MKRIILYLMFVSLVFVGCDYFSPTIDFPMDAFDETACITVEKGLVTNKTLYANIDPTFLDDKFVDNLMREGSELMLIETRATVVVATGEKSSTVKTTAFAHIENYYDSISTIELYMNKDVATVDSLLSGQTYDDVVLTTNIYASIASAFDSVHTQGSEQDWTIEDYLTKAEFMIESTRCLYGKNGSIPALEINERSFRVTCAAVEVMSLYSYLDIAEEDSFTFFFNEHMSMRIWDLEGNRIPMLDNNISLEMAARYGGRADDEAGRIVAKAVYDLEPGRYFVRWIRAEATKSASQFSTNPESPTNYFRFRVGVFNRSYEKDPEIVEVAEKMQSPTVTKELRSLFQCDSTLWNETSTLSVGEFVRSAEKSEALVAGLDTITVDDLDKGIFLEYDETLPQGLFLIYFTEADSATNLSLYVDGGSYTMFRRTTTDPDGPMRFEGFTPNVSGITFKEMFVSKDIANVHHFNNMPASLYVVSVQYDGDAGGINLVFKKN